MGIGGDHSRFDNNQQKFERDLQDAMIAGELDNSNMLPVKQQMQRGPRKIPQFHSLNSSLVVSNSKSTINDI